MIRPAVNGVTFVVEAAAKFNIQRVVITSSVAAVAYSGLKIDRIDESVWTDLKEAQLGADIQSKVLSERLAWDFKNSCKLSGNYCPEIVTILPGVMFGECISSGSQTSIQMIKRLMSEQSCPKVWITCVDI